MSTTRQLSLSRDQYRTVQSSRDVTGTNLREMWSDAVATLALVALGSTVVFEALRLLLR
jgi:hypothetical protein